MESLTNRNLTRHKTKPVSKALAREIYEFLDGDMDKVKELIGMDLSRQPETSG